MATCHEAVIREKSGLEVVNADKSAVFAAEPGGRVKCPSRHSFLVILQHRAVFKQKLLHIWGQSPSHSVKFHDRFLIIDKSTLIHVGASLNHLGKKCFAFSSLDKSNIPDILAKI